MSEEELPTLDQLDRFWRSFEEEIDLEKAATLLERLSDRAEAVGGCLLSARDVVIATRALAVATAEVLHRIGERKKKSGG